MTSSLDCPRCKVTPEPYAQRGSMYYVVNGLRLLLDDFKRSIAESWREAHRLTYATCDHPQIYRSRESIDMFMRHGEECLQCGRWHSLDRNQEKWYEPGEWQW